MPHFTETETPPSLDGWYWMKQINVRYPTWEPVRIEKHMITLGKYKFYVWVNDGCSIDMDYLIENNHIIWSKEEIKEPTANKAVF